MWVMSELAGTFWKQGPQAIRMGSHEGGSQGGVYGKHLLLLRAYLHGSTAQSLVVGLQPHL